MRWETLVFLSSLAFVIVACFFFCVLCGLFAFYVVHSSSSPCTKGFSISSLPSTGEIRTSRVPRATSRPSERVDVLPSSSEGGKY